MENAWIPVIDVPCISVCGNRENTVSLKTKLIYNEGKEFIIKERRREMYECPNCGGNLKFDISSQQLACAYCNAEFDPYSVEKEKDAEESTSYDVTIFICPQCGGEIYSTDHTAAGFCSFCGASTILTSRLQRKQRPGYIIPFKKTKEDCKKAYSKMMKHAIFAPRELKNAKYIDSFRGIYMPYWIYDIIQQGPVRLRGKQENREGDYIVTKYYNLQMNLDFSYKGMSYDASSSFADNISERIAPFDVKNMKEFTPSFLSGFYADTADVESVVYEEEAGVDAEDRTIAFIKKSPKMKGYQIQDDDSKIANMIDTCFDGKNSAMFPVWFLAYRNKDRVAYATVNGQTGKVVADLPVDIKKYLFGSCLLAVPLFFLLNLFLTLRPAVLLLLVCILSTISIILHAMEMKEISIKEQYADDVGAREALRKKRQREWMEAEAAMTLEGAPMENCFPEREKQKEETYRRKTKSEKNRKVFRSTMGKIENIIWISVMLILTGPMLLSSVGSYVLVLAAVVISVIAFAKSASYSGQIAVKKGIFGSLWSLLAVLASVVIYVWKPAADYYYYGAAILSLIALFITLLDLIMNYNILATRKLPQFHYRGGDDRG